MRICYLADAESVHTHRWVRYFADKGHEVHLVSLEPFENCHLANVNMHNLKVLRGMRFVPLMTLVIQIKRLINRIKPDILHAHYALPYGFWGALTMFRPIVMTVWGSDILITPSNSKLSRWKVRFALARADSITCDAEHVIERMTQLGAERQKIKLIYFGVDTQQFNPSKKDSDFKQEMRLGYDSLTVMSLRNLNRLYDVESLIRASLMVLREVPQTKFIIAGNGDQREFLVDLAQSLGVADSVRFVGFIPNDELPRYLASANVYVSTSLSDAGLAASTAEAMASQLPVVITDVADNRNWVKDGEGGFIVPPRNPTVLAERIVYLLKNETTRHNFGAFNRKVMQDRNEYRTQMEKMEHIYKELARTH